VGSIERRLEALEGRLGPAEETDPLERERRRVAFYESLEAACEKAEREEAEGFPHRRKAIEELIESMRRRTRGS
jgi:hypothetical protein